MYYDLQLSEKTGHPLFKDRKKEGYPNFCFRYPSIVFIPH
jgi:hypothetical protein